MCLITFLPDGRTANVPAGTTISEAARIASVRIALPCGGKGRCGRCVVTIDDGHKRNVLACRTAVEHDITVTVPSGDDSDVVASSDSRHSSIEHPDAPSTGYGLAVDIGTTTVAVDILNMTDGSSVYRDAGINRQRDIGEDVLSRIEYACDNGPAELNRLVIDSINDLIDPFPHSGEEGDIRHVVISGNTAMTHLFMNVDPSPIRLPPFEPVFKKAETIGQKTGLHINRDAAVVCMPCISSYVGGDITSDIVYSGMDRNDELALLIDVGTNGEVALGNKDMMLTCSSSAGPAFEGGQMRSGMLAKPGAIDSVRISGGKIDYTTIGGLPPKGICGSGIIDLVAQMFRNGLIDRRGNLTEASGSDDGVFTVTDGIVITQDEINNIIMTKAAIYSASRTMVRKLGIGFSDLSKIYIAGGFGNFINLESAITIGLFPDVERSKYDYLGNASLAGAEDALISGSFRNRIDSAFGKMTYVDLSSEPIFFDEYMSAQFLPHTDKTQFVSIGF